MMILIQILVALIALQHLFFMILEMFFWTKPLGLKVFHQRKETAEIQKVLASNQGLYNGFLSAGLFWSVLHPNADVAYQLMSFFLTCVVVAGVWGGFTFSKRILWVQATPAMATMALLVLV